MKRRHVVLGSLLAGIPALAGILPRAESRDWTSRQLPDCEDSLRSGGSLPGELQNLATHARQLQLTLDRYPIPDSTLTGLLATTVRLCDLAAARLHAGRPCPALLQSCIDATARVSGSLTQPATPSRIHNRLRESWDASAALVSSLVTRRLLSPEH